jgi:hypothetical protein
MRCAGAGTTLRNNVIELNDNDGIDIKDSDGVIGQSGAGNTIQSNGRFGIGVAGSSTASINYNDINNNSDKGIGVSGAPDITILNNNIYNHASGQGLAFGGGLVKPSAGASSGGGNTVTLTGGDTTDDKYTGMVLKTDGNPEFAVIIDYDGTNLLATLNQNWVSTPSSYEVYNAAMATAYAKNNSIYNNAQGLGISYAAPTSDILVFSNDINYNSNATIGAGGVGVQFALSGARVSVSNNILVNNKWTGGGTQPGGLGIRNSSGWVRISNNDFTNDGSASGGAVGISQAQNEADILVEGNTFDGFNSAGGVGSLGIEDVNHGGVVKVDGNTFLNCASGIQPRYVGVQQTASYTGQFGYAGVYNNTFSGGSGGTTGAILFGGVGSGSRINLSGPKSVIDVTGNTVDTSPCAGVRFAAIDGTDSNNPLNGWIIVRNNNIQDIAASKDCRGLQFGDLGNNTAASTNFVNLHVQNNYLPGGIGWGGDTTGSPSGMGEVWITGNEMFDAYDTGGKDEIVVWDNDNRQYDMMTFPRGRQTRTTFMFSGNICRDNPDGDVMWWAGHDGLGYAVDTYWDSNLYSNVARGHGWEHSCQYNMYHRDNRCTNITATKSSGKLSTGGLCLGMDRFNGDRLYYIGNSGHNLAHSLIGVNGGLLSGNKLVIANNYATGMGNHCIGMGNSSKSTPGFTDGYIYGNTVGNCGIKAGIGLVNTGGTYTFQNNIVFDYGGGSTDVIGMGVELATYAYFFNNTIAGDGSYGAVGLGTNNGNFDARGNLFVNVSTQYQTTPSVQADNPVSDGVANVFVDPANDDYHIQNYGGVVDAAGSTVYGESVDMDDGNRLFGSQVDYGADEYGSSGGNEPSISSLTATHTVINGSDEVLVSFTGTDPNDSEIYYKYNGCQYSLDGGVEWFAWEDATIWSSGNNTFSSGGAPIEMYWNVGKDLPNVETNTAKIRVLANDWFSDSNQAETANFVLDTKPPRNLDHLHQADNTQNSITLNWTAAEDLNFDRYEIWYATGADQDVSTQSCGGCALWGTAQDGNLASIGTTTTTISGLDGDYSFNIFAIDTVGHVTAAFDKSMTASTAAATGGPGGPDLLLVDAASSQIPATPGVVIKGNEEAVFAFKLKMHNGTGTIGQLNFTTGSSNTAAHGASPDVDSATLYIDNEPYGVFGIEDTVTSPNFNAYGGGYYSLSANLGHVIDTVGQNYIVTMNIINGVGNTVQLALEGSEAGTPGITTTDGASVDVQSFDRVDGTALTISDPAVVLTASDPGGQPAAAYVVPGQGSTDGVYMQRIQFSTPGAVTVTSIGVQEIGSASATDIAWIAFYEDGGALGTFEPGTNDTLIGSATGPNFSTAVTWPVSGTKYLMVAAKVSNGAISGNIIKTSLQDGDIVVNAPNSASIPASLDSNDFTVAGNPQLQNGAAPSQRLDAGLVDVRYEGKDPDFDTVTYVTAQYSLSNGSVWSPMTNAGNTEEDFQNDWVGYSFVWDAKTDAPDTEDTVSVRLEVTDGANNSGVWEDSVTLFPIDTLPPGAPSTLVTSGPVGYDTIPLTWNQSSGDTNWKQYEIWYRPCTACTVTRGDYGEMVKTVTGDPSIATNATLSDADGIAADTTYSINVWAVDNYGNATIASVTPLEVTTQALLGDEVNVAGITDTPVEVARGTADKGVLGFSLQVTQNDDGLATLNKVKVVCDSANTALFGGGHWLTSPDFSNVRLVLSVNMMRALILQ